MSRRLSLALLLATCTCLTAAVAAPSPPPVMLANVYPSGDEIDLSAYWVSEKLDGVRAYWDGRQLLSRGGNRIAAPGWFTEKLPAMALDGELWAGRGGFEQTTSTTRRQTPDDAAWRGIRYMVFDLPAHPGTFSQRLEALQRTLGALALPWVQPVEQFRIATRETLDRRLAEVVAAGGEGLMLHRADSLYRGVRSDDLLKLKPYEDAEARVVGHLPGKGKYQGLMGALLVERADGLQFRIGSGFTDAQRREPPAIGTRITYAYNGLTDDGVPRFARFLRVRDDEPAAAP